MSSQKGNTSRSRPQKYQNRHTFKNDMHDKTPKTKFINSIQVVNVCERCKKVIEWKIKYKKYKPLKAPAKCTKCEQKVIKHAYHIMCGQCALHHEACPKCGEKNDIVRGDEKAEPIKLDRELRLMLKKLPERRRRTFMRYMNRNGAPKETSTKAEPSTKPEDEENESSEIEEKTKANTQEQHEPLTRDDLLEKLKSLMITSKKDEDDDDDDDFGSDFDDIDDTEDDDD